MEMKKNKAAIKSEPGENLGCPPLPPQSPHHPRLFSSFPPSESREQAKVPSNVGDAAGWSHEHGQFRRPQDLRIDGAQVEDIPMAKRHWSADWSVDRRKEKETTPNSVCQ